MPIPAVITKKDNMREHDWQQYRDSLRILARSQQESKTALKTMITIMRKYGSAEDEIIGRMKTDLQPFFNRRLTKTDIKSLIKGVY